MAMLSMVSVSSHLKTSKSMSSTLAKLWGWMSLLQKQQSDEARENGVGGMEDEDSDPVPPQPYLGETDSIATISSST
jgi:hypothetical protein